MDVIRNVLIVSSHPLFGKGIQRLLQKRQSVGVQVVGIVSTIEAAIAALEDPKPDRIAPNLVIIDYDDEAVNREEFLARFMESEHTLRVVLLSLKEGGSEAVVYDRRTMSASQIDDWLQSWDDNADGNPNEKRSTGMSMKVLKHVIGVLIFVVVLAVLMLLVLQPSILLPPADSAQAQPIDRLFGLHFQMIAVLSAVIVGAMLYSIIFFRRKSDDKEEPTYEAEDRSLSISWIIFPLGALFFYVLLYSSSFFVNFYSTIFPYQEFSFEGFAAIVAAVLGLAMFLALFVVPNILGKGRSTAQDGDGVGYNEAGVHEHAAKENGRLEMAWTALPLGIVLVFAFIGTGALRDVLRQDPKALEVRVIGQQWTWRFEYPDLGITSDALYLPVDKQVKLRMESIDVIHSFWVPEFRVKQDLLPGSVRELRITPTEKGEYQVMCAELCGKQHYNMLAAVNVVSQADFESWVASKALPDDPVGRGEVWYNNYGCKACHTLDGSPLVGPSFLGLFGRQETFEDGTTGVADDAYLYESIREPAKKIVQGYPNAMPVEVAKEMTDEQIAELIEFIKTVK